MKTALTELLESLQKDYDGLDKQKTETSSIFKIAVATIMKNIEDLYISKEKEQIIESFEAGFFDGYELGMHNEDKIYDDSEQYYQQTFKSDE